MKAFSFPEKLGLCSIKTVKVFQVRGSVLGSCLQVTTGAPHSGGGVSNLAEVKNLKTVGDPDCHRGQACGAETQADVGAPVAGS